MISFKNIRFSYKTFKKQVGIHGTIKDLFKREHITHTALDNISFEAEKGEIIALLGPNGAGKTTFIKLLVGLIEPSDGVINVIGFNPYKKSNKYLSQIGLVMGQKSQLTWDLPAIDTLYLLKSIYKIENNDFNKRLNYLVNILNLTEKINTPVRKLSLGERMKFELIASVIHYPKLLILDEPTIGLDIESQRAIHKFLIHINKSENTTILITSHYMSDIEALAKRIIILIKGNIKYDGDIKQLLNIHKQENTLVVKTKSKLPSEIHGYRIKKGSATNEWEIILPVKDDVQYKLISYLTNNFYIESFNIKETPFEDIIFNIFTDNNKVNSN
ncbi:ATP-binding cassette domain-containing protein [Metasolibacillus sp. FSL K6-0083]|uniref:ABC transporter ATP-binding protein n=1 Tax=Metasolibacillus sp. FSL K6-0083 TaxID=2921416 RepID=UPI00315B0FCC